ncbi:uncharacterized protein [Haliotis asinina]|uniref:uncharacterized protein isoform X1 n=1 Tax=Haliotis asinina TaxID=109174 RepID=UPI0035319167
MNVLTFVVLMFIIICQAKKKESNTSYKEFLENEDARLSKKGAKCSLKKLTRRNVDNIRLLSQDDGTARCIIRYLLDYPDDGFLWSVLGHIYLLRKDPVGSQINACFKQATKHTGQHTPFIKDWHFIGPFVIGKMELDGDPVEAFGGIQNVSKYRFQKESKFFSELVPDGVVKWMPYHQKSKEQMLKITPKVNWNDLVSSLGSMGITEWQGWIVGDFAVNADHLNFIVQCMGVSSAYIDGMLYAGDLYHRSKFSFGVRLSRGIHSLHIRLRAKMSATFNCVLSVMPKNFEVLSPTFLPDLYDGNIFGRYISLPVANYHPTRWVKHFRLMVTDQSEGEMLEIKPLKNELAVAPGQIRPFHVKILNKSPKILPACRDIEVEIAVSTSEGEENFPLNIRCRKAGESFLFTFLDHDGSVQHGAAVQPIRSCRGHLCPVVLSLHGTTVPPQNQADSYKKMVGKEFEFGVEHAWLVAPTRHGAHNWEGPGALTAMSAMLAVTDIVHTSAWIEDKADPDHVIFAGHSMGGHGAWHLATHFPDRALALVSLAGWIKKEEYGDSNLFFKHDLSTSHADPAVKAVMEACIAENDADRHVSNLQHIPVLARIGADDRTVHPFYVRRMYRLLQEYRVPANYTELAGKEHWWWDTWQTNDGGVVNDQQLRDFKSKYIASQFNSGGCTADDNDCTGGTNDNKYSQQAAEDQFTLTTINPAFGEGLRGVRILSQLVPYRLSTVEGHVSGNTVHLTTRNVWRFRIEEPKQRKVQWMQRFIRVDRDFMVTTDMLAEMAKNENSHLARIDGHWEFVHRSVYERHERGPENLGPARRVAERQFLIIVGTQGSQMTTQSLLTSAVYIANQFYLTSDTTASIVYDTDITPDMVNRRNIMLLGSPTENLLTSTALAGLDLSVSDSGDIVRLGKCLFSKPRTGVLTLAPNGQRHLTLVLMGLSKEGLMDIISLATPTIPPMARSPFSNLVPDYVITGPDFGWKGPGGFSCAGFYGNQWEYRSDLSSCFCY